MACRETTTLSVRVVVVVVVGLSAWALRTVGFHSEPGLLRVYTQKRQPDEVCDRRRLG